MCIIRKYKNCVIISRFSGFCAVKSCLFLENDPLIPSFFLIQHLQVSSVKLKNFENIEHLQKISKKFLKVVKVSNP